MTTPTLESAPEQAEQKKPTDPAGAKRAPADTAKPAAHDAANPTVADGANPVAEDNAKPDRAEGEKKTADEKAKQAVDEKAKQAATRRRLILMIAAGVVLIAAAILIWNIFFAAPRIPKSIVVVSGRIEGDDSAVASKTTGRILEVRVREGDTVNAGDTIAILDDAQIRAREDQARDTLSEAVAKGAAAQEQIAVLQEQLEQSRLQVGQSKLDTEGHVGQAQADLAAAQSELAQQQAAFKIAAFNSDAYTRLAKTGAVSEQQGLQASTTADQQAAVVAASKRRVESSQGALTTAEASLSNPGIRESQVASVRRQIAQQKAEVASATAQTEQARAELAEAGDNRNDLTIRAPFSGTVVTRGAEPGEVVVAGTAVITLLDLTKVYLRGFVPEGQIGKVKVGQSARIFLDSSSQKPIYAYVSRIDPQATFTPENTYFRDDRVKQVVGLKLRLIGGFGFAKPGMPVDGEVLVQGDTWPKEKRK
ncbi:MAG: HlyD family efflux transporter periplasmic adaptor subunit [Terracidiphilus sp.]|jgi:HlyD family secretion protein